MSLQQANPRVVGPYRLKTYGRRIQPLDQCLQDAKPWNFWVLLRDNRDTVQYWTFLLVAPPSLPSLSLQDQTSTGLLDTDRFGSIVLVLTMLQVILDWRRLHRLRIARRGLAGYAAPERPV